MRSAMIVESTLKLYCTGWGTKMNWIVPSVMCVWYLWCGYMIFTDPGRGLVWLAVIGLITLAVQPILGIRDFFEGK